MVVLVRNAMNPRAVELLDRNIRCVKNNVGAWVDELTL